MTHIVFRPTMTVSCSLSGALGKRIFVCPTVFPDYSSPSPWSSAEALESPLPNKMPPSLPVATGVSAFYRGRGESGVGLDELGLAWGGWQLSTSGRPFKLPL